MIVTSYPSKTLNLVQIVFQDFVSIINLKSGNKWKVQSDLFSMVYYVWSETNHYKSSTEAKIGTYIFLKHLIGWHIATILCIKNVLFESFVCIESLFGGHLQYAWMPFFCVCGISIEDIFIASYQFAPLGFCKFWLAPQADVQPIIL